MIKKYFLLEKGLNFAVTPDAISHSEFVASVEKDLKNVKNVDKVALSNKQDCPNSEKFQIAPEKYNNCRSASTQKN